MTVEVRVPTLGESVSEATVATWFKKPGDAVAMDEMLCELETDKETGRAPSSDGGMLAEVVAPEGEKVGPEALLAQSDETGAAAAPRDATTGAAQPAADETADRGKPKMAGKSVDVMVPTLGESVTEATVATWLKKVGDAVAQDEMLCELETDKVSVEVPSPVAGVLAEILAEEGATVDAKARLAIITAVAAGRARSRAEEGATADAKARLASITEGAAGGSTGGPGPGDAPVSDPDKRQEQADIVNSPGAGPEQLTLRSDVEGAPSAKKAM